MEEHVMPAGGGYLTGPFRLDLTDHVCQVKLALGMLPSLIAHYLDRIDQRHRLAPQESDQLRNRGNTEYVDPRHQLCLSGLA
jgi:hypothetical protein